MVKQELINILVCPKCRGKLAIADSERGRGLGCAVCKVVYPIRDDIPIMLIEQAIPEEKWQQSGGEGKCES